MGIVYFIIFDGQQVVVLVKLGNMIMEVVVVYEVLGIEVQCYGVGICGICYVYVEGVLCDGLLLVLQWECDMFDNFELVCGELWFVCQICFEEVFDGVVFCVFEWQDVMS